MEATTAGNLTTVGRPTTAGTARNVGNTRSRRVENAATANPRATQEGNWNSGGRGDANNSRDVKIGGNISRRRVVGSRDTTAGTPGRLTAERSIQTEGS
jgi:hypothetical protein